jgi:hypothetical protein
MKQILFVSLFQDSMSQEELIEGLDLKGIDLGNDNAERLVQVFFFFEFLLVQH